jgi:hypothetical protein
MHLVVDDSHRQIDHHSLRSSHYTENALSLNQDGYSDGAINDYNDDDSLASIFFWLIHPCLQMILIMPANLLMIIKKRNNNRVKQHRNYKSSSII